MTNVKSHRIAGSFVSAAMTFTAMLAAGSVLFASGCTATMPQAGSDKCALSASQNADTVLGEALYGVESGCAQDHFEGYLQQLLNVSKTAPAEPDRVQRIVELLDAAEAKGAITYQGKVETINRYFNVKFVAAKSKNTIFSKGCENQGHFFRALDAELQLKKIGLLEIGEDVAAFNSAKALNENLKGTFEAACHASGA